MKKKIISIILVIVLSFSLVISASALSITGRVNPTTPVSYEYVKSGLASHKTDKYTYTDMSGKFFNSFVGVPIEGSAASAQYTYQFQVTETGSYYFSYQFSSNQNVKNFRVYIDDLGSFSTFGDWSVNGNDTSYGNQSILLPSQLKSGHTYKLSFIVSQDNISLFSPTNYNMHMGFSYSATGQIADVDTPVTSNSTPYLTLDHIDSQGRYWYQYHGLGKPSIAYENGYNGTANIVDSGGADYASGYIQQTGGYTSSYRMYVRYYTNASLIQAPITGTYRWGYSLLNGSAKNASNQNPVQYTIGYTQSAINVCPPEQTYPIKDGIVDNLTWNQKVLKGQGDYLTNWSVMGTNSNGSTKFGFELYQGSNFNFANLKLYAVVEPIQPFEVTPDITYNIDIDETTTIVNTEVAVKNESQYDLQFPDYLGVWGTHTTISHYYDETTNQLNWVTDDGYNGSFIYTPISLNIHYVYQGETYDYVFMYQGAPEPEDVPNPDDHYIHDPDSGDDGGEGFLEWLWRLLMEGLKAVIEGLVDILILIFSTVLDLLLKFVTMLWDIISTFLVDAVAKITELFAVFNDQSPAFDFFNGGVTWEY